MRGGVANLTFDKVAAASGLSKGGILFHFSSKNELVKKMVEPFVWRFKGGGLDGLKRMTVTKLGAICELICAPRLTRLRQLITNLIGLALR